MPIRFVGNQGLRTGQTASPGGATSASFSMRLKLNNTSHVSDIIFGKQYGLPVSVLPQAVSGSTVETRLIFTAGGVFYEARPYLTVGLVYHLAARWNGTTATFFVNNTQVGSVAMSGALDSTSQSWQVGGFGGTFDFLASDICCWDGYYLTSQDILDLRDQTKVPGDLGTSGQRRINWSLSGTPGATVTLADAGVTGGAVGAATTRIGTPVYTADSMAYVPPARVLSAYVGESRKTLVFTFESVTGSPTTVTAVSSHPTVTLNGEPQPALGTPVPVWTSGYVLYPLPFTVALGDTLTASSAEGWVTTAVGSCAGMSNLPVTTSETLMFTRAAEDEKTMKVGMNIRGPEYWDHIPVYVNLAKQGNAGLVANGGSPTISYNSDYDPTVLTGGEGKFIALSYGSSGIGSPDKGYPNLGAGTVTLKWDGANQVRLAGDVNTLSQTSYTRTYGANNTRVYNNTLNASYYYSHIEAILDGPDVRNIRIYGPTVTSEDSSKFHPQFTAKASGARVIRFLNAMDVNNSNITTFSRFTPTTRRSYGGGNNTNTRSVTTAAPYAGSPSNYFVSGRIPFTCTTSAPHGYTTGEVVTFSSQLDNLVLNDNSTLTVPANHVSQVLVLSPTTFAACIYTGNSKTVKQSQTFRSTTYTSVMNTMPIEDIVALCEELDADPWILIPHALDDAGVRSMIDVFAEGLSPGRKLYVEYSNECWHYTLYFLQTEYCDGQGATLGINGRQWYARRSSQVHQIAEDSFTDAGRSADDIVRVYATQSANPGGVTTPILAYAAAQGYRVDALACAPYFQVTPSGFTSTYDSMDAEQVLDLSALAISSYPTSELAAQKAVLQTYFPNARLVCYEGSLELFVPSYSNATAASTKSRACSRHPRVREQTLKYLQNAQDVGCDLFCWFELNMYHFNQYTWGVYPASWNMQDGLGDGSDGKFDNRTNYDDLPNIVSVAGAALKQWYGLTAAEEESAGAADHGFSLPNANPFVPTVLARHRASSRWGR